MEEEIPAEPDSPGKGLWNGSLDRQLKASLICFDLNHE